MMARMNRARAAARRLITVSTFLAAFAGMAVLAVTTSCPALAAPEPSPIPKRWQLDISTSPLHTAVVNVPGGGTRAFFFMTYKVTNNSAQDLLFAPSFELATDEGDLLRSGRDVSLDVTRDILGRLDNPLIEDQISIVGTLLRGPENAKQGLVIWPITQDHLTEVAVYCAGFSGETATVDIPAADNPKQNVKKLLRKSWMLRYRMPGDMKPGGSETYDPNESKWIMR